MKRTVIIVIVSGMILSSSVFSATIRVPSEQPTIQTGIDAAVNGDTVLVADGTYTGDGNRDIDFKGKAITVASENGAETCIIDCHGSETAYHRGFNFHSDETNDSILQGVKIQNGHTADSGGGIYIRRSSPQIVECIISNNASYKGGGIYCFRSSLIIIKCIISNNSSSVALSAIGGGIYCEYSSLALINCTISDNSADTGFFSNTAGGIFMKESSSWISSCIISQNHAGGGILGGIGGIQVSRSSSWISDCKISKNNPGGISFYECDFSTITNCLITENYSESNYGGISCFQSPLNIINCIVSQNSNNGVYCDDSDPVIRNCIILNNNPSNIACESNENPQITYSNLIWNGNGIGNMSSDPLFIGGDPFDYHFSSQSPCIDAGTDKGASPTDLDGKQRPRGGGVDMGAYEYQSWPLTVRTYVEMPSHEIFPGDVTSCSVSVWNSEYEAIEESPLFVVLDIMGTYYFAPSFSSYDFFERRFPFGLTKMTIIPEFSWPAGAGSASNIVWYAFLSNHEQTELMSNIGVFDFSWSE